MATKKIKLNTSSMGNMTNNLMHNEPLPMQEQPTIETAAMNNTPAAETTTETPTAENAAVSNPAADKEKKILVNVRLSESFLNRLRNYCDANDMTLTAGIKRAIREMLAKEGK